MKPIDRLAENMALKTEREEIMSEMNRRTNESIQIRKENLHLKLENSALKSENEKLREAIQNFLDTCEATNPLINGPTFVAIDALHAVMEGK